MAKGPPQLDAGLPLQSILGTSDLASKSEEPKLGHELQSKLGPGRRLGARKSSKHWEKEPGCRE